MARSGLRDVIAIRAVRVFFGANLVAWSGLWMQKIAVGWHVWQLEGSPFWLGALAFADLFPAVLVSPIAGAVADRVDRKRLTIGLQIAVSGYALAMAALIGLVDAGVTAIVLLEVVNGVLQPFSQPARQSLIPGLVPRENLPSAIALNSITFNIARFLGPALAGVLIARTSVLVPILFNAAAWLFATASLARLAIPASERLGHPPSGSGLIAETIAGLRYAARHPGLGPLLLFALACTTLVRPVFELLPGFADDVFGQGAAALAALTSSIGLGAFVGAAVVGMRSNGLRGLTPIAVHAGLFQVVAVLGFVASSQFEIALIAAGALGAGSVVQAVAVQTLNQARSEAAMRGRMLALWGMVIRVGPALGALIIGAASDLVGLRLPVAAAALLCFIAWSFAALRLSNLRRSLEVE